MTIRFTYGNKPQHVERVRVETTNRSYCYDKGEYIEEAGHRYEMKPVAEGTELFVHGEDQFTGETGKIAKADINDRHMIGHHSDEWEKENDSTEPKPGTPLEYMQDRSGYSIGTLCRIYLKGVHIGCVIKFESSWRGVGSKWAGYRLDGDGVYRVWLQPGRYGRDRESTVSGMAQPGNEATAYDEETEQSLDFHGEPLTNYHGEPRMLGLTLAEIWQAAQGGFGAVSERRRTEQLKTAAIVNGVVIFGLRN